LVVIPLSAPNVEKLVVAFLGPHFANVATEMGPNPSLPFLLVTRLSSPSTEITDHATVDVDVFDTDMDNAGDTADSMHDLMRKWTAKNTVSYGGQNYGIQLLETLARPFFLNYEDVSLKRYVARYRIQLRVT
jgi:hypothetical protein